MVEVGEHQVGRRAFEGGQGDVTGPGLADVVARGGEQLAEREPDRLLVVDDEDPQPTPLRACVAGMGTRRRNSAPPPGASATSIAHPDSFAIRRTTARPSPLPPRML